MSELPVGLLMDQRVLEFLDFISIERIDPEWLPSPAFLLSRRLQERVEQDCGKGLEVADAWTSVFFEAIERHSAELVLNTTAVKATSRELGGEIPLVRPGDLVVGGEELNDLTLSWSEGTDLLSGDRVLVPSDCVYFPYPSLFLQTATTGLAAHQSWEMAVLHALFELIEHDTLSLYSFTGLPFQELIDSENGLATKFRSAFTEGGVVSHTFYLRNDSRIPVFLTTAFAPERMPGVLIAGVGCHLDPHIALRRSLTECSQSAAFWHHRYATKTMEEKPICHPPLVLKERLYRASVSTVHLEEIDYHDQVESDKLLQQVLNHLEQITSRVVVVDLPSGDLGVPVVRAVIPELEDIFDGAMAPRGRTLAAKAALERYVAAAQ